MFFQTEDECAPLFQGDAFSVPLEIARSLCSVPFSRDTHYTSFLFLCLSIVPAAGNPQFSPHLLSPLGNSTSLATPWHHTGLRDTPQGSAYLGSANQSKKGVLGFGSLDSDLRALVP